MTVKTAQTRMNMSARRGTGQTERNRKKKWKIVLIAVIAVAVCGGLFWVALSAYSKYQMSKVPELSFQEALEYTTKDNAAAVITVGIIKDGNTSYTVYGENGKELPKELHTYEIGSLTKTFTAAMVSKAAQDGEIDISATIDQYLSLPEGNVYPTVAALLTHTSGYKSHYIESPMISNFFTGKNSFLGVTKTMVVNKASELSVPKEDYPFNYSNFGYAVLGLILEEVYGDDYTTLANQFAKELNLSHTQLSTQNGDLGKYWDWNDGDAYLSAGGLTSNVNDMLTYAQFQLDESGYFADCHKELRKVDAAPEQYKAMGINMDAIGMAWIIDSENGVVWHNGGTGNYNSYLGFSVDKNMAVIVLSNLAPNYRIPATVLGVKLFDELE